MPHDPATIDYGRDEPHPDRWQWDRVRLWLIALCVVLSVLLGLISFVTSVKLATATPAYVQFRQRVQAEAATRPAGTTFAYPPFSGQAYTRRPLLSVPTTYAALAFAAAGVVLIVLDIRATVRPRG